MQLGGDLPVAKMAARSAVALKRVNSGQPVPPGIRYGGQVKRSVPP